MTMAISLIDEDLTTSRLATGAVAQECGLRTSGQGEIFSTSGTTWFRPDRQWIEGRENYIRLQTQGAITSKDAIYQNAILSYRANGIKQPLLLERADDRLRGIPRDDLKQSPVSSRSRDT